MANWLTFGRMIAVLPFTVLFLLDASWNMTAALIIFVLAAITDFFDGWIARRRNEVSELGAAIDPIADKLLIVAALILLVRNGVIHDVSVIAVLVIVLREVLVSGLREAVGNKGHKLPVSFLAKIKTTAQLIATAALLAVAPNGILGASFEPLAIGLLWVSAVLTFWTGASYTRHAVEILRPPTG